MDNLKFFFFLQLLDSHLDYSGGCCGVWFFLRPMTSPFGELTSNNSAAGRMSTEQSELSEKTQLGTEQLLKEQRESGTVLTSSVIDEISNQVFANATENSVILLPAPPQHDSEKNCQNVEGSHLQQSTDKEVSLQLSNDKPENPSQPLSENEPVESVSASAGDGQKQSSPAQANTSYVNKLLDPPNEDAVTNFSEKVSNSPANSQSRRKGKRNSKLLKKTYMLRSIGSSDRALRSKTKENPKTPEPSSNLVDFNNNNSNAGGKRKTSRKKRKSGEVGITDQFSRIKSHLRYLLNRISYEKSLIDAYSGEGWKGYRCVHFIITLCLVWLVIYICIFAFVS